MDSGKILSHGHWFALEWQVGGNDPKKGWDWQVGVTTQKKVGNPCLGGKATYFFFVHRAKSSSGNSQDAVQCPSSCEENGRHQGRCHQGLGTRRKPVARRLVIRSSPRPAMTPSASRRRGTRRQLAPGAGSRPTGPTGRTTPKTINNNNNNNILGG